MNKPVKVYELYLTGGGFSVKTIDYNGRVIAVAATSVKQAYYLAYNKVWAKDSEVPLGIIWTYNKWEKGPDHTFWNGTTGWGLDGYGASSPQHGEGKKAIIRWMKEMEGNKDRYDR
jgi:hypothetical protein